MNPRNARSHPLRRRTAVLAALSGAALAAVPAGVAQAACHRSTTVVVAPDGSGDFTTVQAAVDAAPAGNTQRYTIRIKPGTYKELVTVPSDKPYLSFVGTGRQAGDVVITYDNANGTPKPGGGTYGTSGSASVTIDGNDFTARNLTFANSFDEAAHPDVLALARRDGEVQLAQDDVVAEALDDPLETDAVRAVLREYGPGGGVSCRCHGGAPGVAGGERTAR